MESQLFVFGDLYMGKITALRRGRGRVNVYIDGELRLSLSAHTLSSEGLQRGQELSSEDIQAIEEKDRYQRCLAAATAYLAVRPRSESEMRQRLQRRGFDTETQDRVLKSLAAKGLVDDAAFAAFWTENRETFSPRSRRLARIELLKKGVAADDIEKAVSSIDDESSAYRAALSRVRGMRWEDRQQFRRKLGGYLERRGFGYGVIETTLKKVWSELANTEGPVRGTPEYVDTDLEGGR